MEQKRHIFPSPLVEDFEDFFENSLCGFVIAGTDGKIIRANTRMASWLDYSPGEVAGLKFSELLSIGGKIYFETHLWPMLRMQGFFDEISLELEGNGKKKMQVLVNAFERRDSSDQPQFIRLTIFRATDRRIYEQNLKTAKAAAEVNLTNEQQLSLLREQFIAILGHDLRNPLGAVMAGISMLSYSELSEENAMIVRILERSAGRMNELIRNIMDFARTRLGGGIIVDRGDVLLTPVLTHVIDELKVVWPDRVIGQDLQLAEPVNCDPGRISQLLSNLLANALTHGAGDMPIHVNAFHQDGIFELSVKNFGNPIPADLKEHLFEPFTRDNIRPSQNGLGLGLFIASEISRAHQGTLTVISNNEHTIFTFRMKT